MSEILTDLHTNRTTERNNVFEYVKTMMAGQIIDLDLDPIHYETALDRAITRYRQRSPNSVEESYGFLELLADVNEYRLPDEVITVRRCSAGLLDREAE